MFYPNRHRERLLRTRGFVAIAGVDEAGRGAWAGPIVAAAVILKPGVRVKGIKDSKKLRILEREASYHRIINSGAIWAIGIVDAATIDKIGIGAANLEAMRHAIKTLAAPADYVLADGPYFTIDTVPYKAIIAGDHKVTSIAAASIIAKVYRDQLMDDLDELYPAYGFKQHKGYGTAHHHNMLMRYGLCEIHRKSFEPMKFLKRLDS